MNFRGLIIIGGAFIGFSVMGCVPSTQYKDSQERIRELQTKVDTMETSSTDCDRDVAIQLREQVQSLDLLQQELVDRNTELSKEVARLKVVESQTKTQAAECEKQIHDALSDGEGKLQRTRATYEDLIKEQKEEIRRLREQLAAAQQATEAAKTPKKSSKKK